MIRHLAKKIIKSFITQGTSSRERMTLCEIQKFCEKCNLPYGYFNGKVSPKKIRQLRKELQIEKKVYVSIKLFIESYGNQKECPYLKQLRSWRKFDTWKRNLSRR